MTAPNINNKKHAQMSPSAATRWMACPGSVPLSAGLPDTTNKYAEEGSCAHEVAAICLEENQKAAAFIGRIFHNTAVTDDMAEHVDSYTQTVRDYLQHPTDDLHIEVSLPIHPITGEDGATGTADGVVLSYVNQEITVIDLKFGRQLVEAEQNLQLVIYALAVLELFGVIAEWKSVRLVIVQPRAGGVREWSVPVEVLEEMRLKIERAADAVRLAEINPAQFLSPGSKQCQYCKAKATCPALQAEVISTVESVPEVTQEVGIAHLLPRLDLIESWCEAVRAEANHRLTAGIDVPGYKLVAGKKGARAWTDEAAAETTLKSMRLKQEEMYSFKLISPTQAEKVLKETPKRWTRLQELIAQKSGSPSVVPAADPRPSITVSADEFTAIPETV